MSASDVRTDQTQISPSWVDRARRRWSRDLLPYALIAPALVAMIAMLGWPLIQLGVLSFKEFGLAQVFGQEAKWTGFENFRSILTDREFWVVLRRTVLFCIVNVALTMLLGFAVALLLNALNRGMRFAVSMALILAWAMPALTATVVWQWIFDTQYGLANWVFGRQGESWLVNPLSFYSVATIIVVWMGIPFVSFTLYAGLSQISKEVLEAARIDGAGSWRQLRDIVIPLLKPIIMILTSLSVLWDFRVFTQIYVLQAAGGIREDTNVIGVYAYRLSIGSSDFGAGAAVALVMVAITMALTMYYLREMAQQEDL